MISILFITLALLLLCVFYSLFLTSQFSIDSSFNKSKEFQGSLLFFALFNFQDAVLFSLASLEDSLFIISHSFRFVKYFFQVFSNLFECSLPAFLSATFILYHISFVLSTPFSKFFQNFFRDEISSFLLLSSSFTYQRDSHRLTLSVLSVDSFIIISLFFSFVKPKIVQSFQQGFVEIHQMEAFSTKSRAFALLLITSILFYTSPASSEAG